MPTSTQAVSAYIPCYNNARTLEAAIDGIRRQSVPVDELFVVDDGSTDASREVAAALQVRVVEMKTNRGRGAVRARAMEEARHDLVLCSDATNRLQEDFLRGALRHFEDPRVAGVVGRILDMAISGVVSRWRARHIFRQDLPPEPVHPNILITWGTLMRKSAVMKAGNFDPALRFAEDLELGGRLNRAGYEILMDSSLITATQVKNTMSQAIERYLRWNDDGIPRDSLYHFILAQHVAWRILVPRDLRASDPLAAGISLLMPFYRLFGASHLKNDPPKKEAPPA